jgi:hypothetical protein
METSGEKIFFLSPEGQCLWFSLDMVSIKEKANQNA